MLDTARIIAGAGFGLLTILLCRLSLDFFRRGTNDIAVSRGVGFGWSAWRNGELPDGQSSNGRTMRGLHVQVTADGLDYCAKSTISRELV